MANRTIIDQMFQARFDAGRDEVEFVRLVLHPDAMMQIMRDDADHRLSFEMLEAKTIMGYPFVEDPTMPKGTWKFETRPADL
jgi:hypothetical protein